MSLVEESLRLSPEQRLLRHQAALELVLAIEQVGREMRERAQQARNAPAISAPDSGPSPPTK